jgi:hypothetical protein
MKKRLLYVTFALAVITGATLVDTVPTFAAQKEPRCRQKDTLLIATTPEQQQADRDKDGYVCQSLKDGHYYNA